jgi:aspartate racemase
VSLRCTELTQVKILGLIGGVGPETTVEYYRLLVEQCRARTGKYPRIIINSVDLQLLLDWMAGNELDKVADYGVKEIERLYHAGAELGALASNTPHIVFDQLRERSKIPLVSIVEATCEHAKSLALSTVALIGTRYTMLANFYPKVFNASGLKLVTPNPDEQSFIHEKYINELLNNQFLPETRAAILNIIDDLKKREDIDAVILGGTELPLLLRANEHNGTRLLDTSRIHVAALVEAMLQ